MGTGWVFIDVYAFHAGLGTPWLSEARERTDGHEVAGGVASLVAVERVSL